MLKRISVLGSKDLLKQYMLKRRSVFGSQDL